MRKALDSLMVQTVIPEIIVIDDGSDDGTSSMVKTDYPGVVLISHDCSKGLIVRRNEGVVIASNRYVLSIDDDCVLENEEIIREMCDFVFLNNPAAVAWPYIDVSYGPDVRNAAPDEAIWETFSFRGCSFLVDKSIFLAVGGFRENFIHQGEEEDLCIRIIGEGGHVVLGKGHPVHHYESPRRNLARMDYYGSRNLVLFSFFNLPFPFNFIQAMGSSLNSAIYGFKIKRPVGKIRGVFGGWKDIWKHRFSIKPVSTSTYFRFRKLKKRGPLKVL